MKMGVLTKAMSRALAGKRIVRIEIERRNVREHAPEYVHAFDYLVLDDGSVLRPVVAETDFGEYVVELVKEKP